MRLLAVLLILAVGLPADAAHRSRAARAAFQRTVACPATGRYSGPCPGYVVDHITPLACGGADAPSNMQYQTISEGKAKDRVELTACLRR